GVGVEGELHGVGDVAGQGPPAGGHFLGGQVVPLGQRPQLDHHLGEMALAGGVAPAGPVPLDQRADAGEHVDDHRAAL
ncbi:hypothetical protein DF186_25340, partial [Enterococcus hirae]